MLYVTSSILTLFCDLEVSIDLCHVNHFFYFLLFLFFNH